MMKIAVMQPYLFPYIGYFQMMKSVDEFVIFDDVAFSRGWINRNYYLVGGDKKLLTVSLKDAGPNKLINEIEIIDDFKKIRSTLTQAYAKAPYKQPVIELIERVCDYSDRNLARFIKNSFDEIQNYIGFTTTLSYSSEIKKDPSLKGQEKILAVCEARSAETYINAIGGQDLYDRSSFNARGEKLKFI
jgi:hypothetical protein